MATLPTLYRGENRLFSRNLVLADKVTALPVASLAGARVEVLQGKSVKATAVLGTDAALHAGAAANELVYELTSAVSAALSPGIALTLRWTIKQQNAAFVVEPGAVFIDIIEQEVVFVGK